jgi:ABC-type oligopeptide transport system substrate-binding subunit
MKSVKLFAIVALMALVAVACGKVEKILPKGTGLWKISSSHEVSYLNNVLESDVTRTDSLGQIYFDKAGTGYSTEFASTTKDNFTWTVNDDNDIITITSSDTGAVAIPADILESSSKQMTIFISLSGGVAPFNYKFENTQILDRIK